MTRRNMPDINPNGATWRGVRVHPDGKKHYSASRYSARPEDPYRASGVWRRVMRLVWCYQAAGFDVTYSERMDGKNKVADITVRPPGVD